MQTSISGMGASVLTLFCCDFKLNQAVSNLIKFFETLSSLFEPNKACLSFIDVFQIQSSIWKLDLAFSKLSEPFTGQLSFS